MPLPVIANTYRVALDWVLGSSIATNVMHFTAVGSSAGAVAASVNTNVTAAMWGFVSLSAQVQQMAVTPLDGSTATLIFPTSGAKWTGSQGGDWSPASCGIVSLRTNLRGRSHRGRLYIPFVAEAAMTNGALVAGQQSAAGLAWTNFLTAMSAASVPLQVASYKLVLVTPCTATIVELALGTQRRRQSRLR